jgi:hypothetical protein
MALAVRFQTTAFAVIRHPSGRTYTANASGICDVPYAEAEQVHGQGARVTIVGATADRPKPDPNRLNWPQPMLDSTLNKMIYPSSGGGWVDATGTAV